MEPVKYYEVDHVAVLTLNEPDSMNALSATVLESMNGHLGKAFKDPSVRAIVLTGSGKAFCAGGDVRLMQNPANRTAPVIHKRMETHHGWARALLDSTKPVIAAVNGAAVGAGLGLALLADLIFASREAYFMAAFSKIGALPDLRTLQSLPWAIGSLRAKEMVMLNRRYSGEEAVAIGLANRCCEPDKLMDETLAAAKQIAAGPAPMMAMSKKLMKRAFESSTDAFFELEALGQTVTFGSDAFAEGVDAFLNKRKPDFASR